MPETIIGQPPGAGAAGAAALVKDTDTRGFAKDVIEASKQAPVIVDFWASWCGPCKQLGPILEKTVKAARGAVRLVKIDVDKNQQLAAQFRVQSIPAVYAFFGGRPVDAFVGAQPESQVKAFVDRLAKLAASAKGGAAGAAGDPVAEALALAKEMLDKGQAQEAASVYADILQHEPENAPAKIGLARAAMALGDAATAKKLLAELPAEAQKGADVQQVRAALDLAERAAAAAGAAGALEAKLAANANDHQARLDLALARFAGGDAAGAIDHLLHIVRRQRDWNEGAARKELLKIFEALGAAHPETLRGRRGLSSILFS
jgi:putative thioredoxin